MSHVVCLMNVEAERATFTWSEGPASFEPYTLDGMVYKEFKEIAAEAREKLADLVKDYLFDEQGMPKSALALAEAGHELYQAMFQPGAEQARQARQVRKWLEELAQEHEVDTLEIVVESPWSLAWNIVYDQPPDQAAFLANDESPDRWLPFWGLRYNLAGGRKVDPLRRMPLLRDPKVLLAVDPEIRDGLPEEQQKRLAEFVDKHRLKIVHSKDELQDAIRAERPDLLYWLSHATADALLLAGEPISPRNMRKLLRQEGDEKFGGLAFLNACQTAQAGEAGSFFQAFHSVGFAGMIGTESETVDLFASPLGLDFLEAFLERGESVGTVLRKLRGRVPLGLLYGTYCPPDIRVDRASPRDDLEVQQVRVTGKALGVALPPGEITPRPLPPLPDEPYRALAYYDRDTRALFAGRDDDIERFARILDDATTRIVVLHGESGVGKSSFLRAGVIPYLEEECLGYRFLRAGTERATGDAQGSVIFIRATNDLFGQLAQTLCDFCAQPYEYRTPLGELVSADLPGLLRQLVGHELDPALVRAALDRDPSLLGRILAALSDSLPFAAVLVIDQGEEVFTLAQTPADLQQGRAALEMLRRTVSASGTFKLILSLRTEYYGRLVDRLRRGLHDTDCIREYLLTDFEEDDLIAAICRPTTAERIPYTSDVPVEKYGFGYAEGVPEQIARGVMRFSTQRRDSVLPLVQVICVQLYGLARQRQDSTVTAADLAALGGIEGGMRRHVEQLLREQLLKEHPQDKKAVQHLFTRLYLRQPDGTLTTALLAEDTVAAQWRGRLPFGQLLASAERSRLLRVNSLRIGGQDERRYVSLGHDSLAKLAADWDEELSRGARMRKMARAIGVVSLVALVMAFLAGLAWFQRHEAVAQRNRAVATTAAVLASADLSPADFQTQTSGLRQHREPAVEGLREILDPRQPPGHPVEAQRVNLGRKRAQAAIALFHLEDAPAAVEFLRVEGGDPETQTQFIARCQGYGVKLQQLLGQLHASKQRLEALRSSTPGERHVGETSLCYGLLLALGEYLPAAFVQDPRTLHNLALLKEWKKELITWYRQDPSSAIHSACGWLLRRSWPADGTPRRLDAIDRELHCETTEGWADSHQEWRVLRIPPAKGSPAEAAEYITFIVFPKGSFLMGTPPNSHDCQGRRLDPGGFENQKEERIDARFAICDREVTQRQWQQFLSDASGNGDPSLPATSVSWDDVGKYCEWMTALAKPEHATASEHLPRFRLPTEKEWEYACRAGTITTFGFGSDYDLLDRYCATLKTTPVACLRPNLRGLFDVHGNVREWCADWFMPYDRAANGAAAMTPDQRVLRGGGGSFALDACRSAARGRDLPKSRAGNNGFRLCLSLPPGGEIAKPPPRK